MWRFIETMDGFKIFDADYHEINADGLRVVECKDGLHIFPGATPKQPAFFDFKCPRRGERCGYLRIRGGAADDGKRPSWIWNGNRDKPTMTPSINCLAHNPSNPAEKYAGCGWHGWITNGECRGA